MFVYPDKFLHDQKERNLPVFIGQPEVSPSSKCKNCGDMGIFVAFYSDHKYPRQNPEYRIIKGGVVQKFIPGVGWFDGEHYTLPCPVCSTNSNASFLSMLSNLKDRDLEIRIDDFTEQDGKKKAREVALELIAGLPIISGFHTFHGSFGVGKTTLLMALINHCRLMGVSASYWRITSLLADIRNRFGESMDAVEKDVNFFSNIQVLALDEIDKLNPTDWALETLHRVIDERYRMRHLYTTFFALNQSPEKLDKGMWGYLVSRWMEGNITFIGGADMRRV